MSIFKVLDSLISKNAVGCTEYTEQINNEDALRGTNFMFFALSSMFPDKGLEDIEKGIVDSSYRQEKYDFGVDAVYITGSNDFIETPDELQDHNEDTKFKIHMFQFKSGTGISQADLLKFKSGIERSLIDESVSDNENLYFSNRMSILNDIKTILFSKYNIENISIKCHIVFGGMEENITSQSILMDEINNISSLLKNNGFSNSEVVITDCKSLIESPGKNEQIIDVVEYQKTFKYITETENSTKLNGYISIINGKDIADLVKKHQTSIFEANIRDYYKRNDLNSKIVETSCSNEESKFFWSYNNGLTMTCSKVEEMPNNKYKLHNLQIVNGCQTSNSIYIAVKNKDRVNELRSKISDGSQLSKKEQDELNVKEQLQFNESTSLLVKIIETKDQDFIYRITETTNSQTPIKAFSLKANDDIQKLIEKYLEDNNINYERRINSLKNKGKRNIYNIQKLFQLYNAQILFKPSIARTRPKDLFISQYDSVFPEPKVKSMSYLFYLIPIKVDIAINKGLKDFIKNNPSMDLYQKTLITYGSLHLGCFLLSSILKGDYNEKGIIKKEAFIFNELENNIDLHLRDAIDNLGNVIRNLVGNKKESILSAVRMKDLDDRIVRFVKSRK